MNLDGRDEVMNNNSFSTPKKGAIVFFPLTQSQQFLLSFPLQCVFLITSWLTRCFCFFLLLSGCFCESLSSFGSGFG